MKPACCLAIGGSDSCGGAGVQADLLAIEAQGIKGCTVITALTAQTPDAVIRIEKASLEQIEAEMRGIFSYYEVLAVKTGMLLDAQRVQLVAKLLAELHQGGVLVVDPVMVASSGTRLLTEEACAELQASLFPLATLITPNIPETEVLLGEAIDSAEVAAEQLFSLYGRPVLLKGGHSKCLEEAEDVLFQKTGQRYFKQKREAWSKEVSHGSGCRLASAITACLAKGESLENSIAHAKASLSTYS